MNRLPDLELVLSRRTYGILMRPLQKPKKNVNHKEERTIFSVSESMAQFCLRK